MAATTQQIAQLRRMVNEPDETTYDDNTLSDYIERYPLLDENGQEPYTVLTGTQPPTHEANLDWFPTYDLHAAAADIWEEKAAVVAVDFDFSADGGSFSRSEVYEQYMKQARYHRARRAASTARLHKWPPEGPDRSWLANYREED